MNKDKYVFAQLVEFLDCFKFRSKSSLARANPDRDYCIFEEFAFYLVSEARKRCCNDIFELGDNVYAFDSTTIDLCLEVFW